MGIFDKLKAAIKGNADAGVENFDNILQKTREEFLLTSSYFYDPSINKLSVYVDIVGKWENSKKIDFAVYCIEKICSNATERWDSPHNRIYEENQLRFAYLKQIFRSKLTIKGSDLKRIIVAIYNGTNKNKFNFQDWSLAFLLNQFSKQQKEHSVDQEAREALTVLKKHLESTASSYFEKEKTKLLEKIEDLLFEKEEGNIRSVLFLGEDDFTPLANSIIEALQDRERFLWYELIAKAQKATGAKPSKKYITEAKAVITDLGTDKFKKTVHELFTTLINLKETVTEHRHNYSGAEYVYIEAMFLSSLNTEALKGLVWMCSLFYDQQTIQTISKLADRCFKKIPQKGPSAPGVGNACLYTLANSKGLDGISQLSRLRLKIKQNNTLKIIENYIQEAAAKHGVTTHEIEDLAVDDFKLKEGEREWNVGDFTAVLHITGVGKSTIVWLKEDGKEQKSVPAVVKYKHATLLKKIKDVQKQVDQATSTQRDRFDRMLRSNREIKLEYFKERYVEHGLLGWVTNNLIFNFIGNDITIQAIRSKDKWITATGDEADIVKYTHVSLWHPAVSSTAQVKLWRDYLIANKVLQPFKQAFREIYLLTEAEINTRTYSNRMASHILKQHQYVTLAKGRNWTARLIGAWDGGDQDTASLLLPEYNLRAEYWVNALNADVAFNETGIWNYVTTDQIRFINTQTNELVDLIDVPTIPFSEALRDVDLFVGVASVGNDPTWQDSGGLPAYRDYWQAYSFGDLSEVAKNRKEILAGLIPRLKIAGVTTIQDKFVVVKGKLRTYKIHIGSTNILMEPNDQYLCIVPDRSKKDNTENIYLPFEGDNGLSVILSKAFLLAADDKITDSTITSQINR
ncbi:DUF4132 domain-containing protein [Flavobacterium coralii]|uniref:DUF4132 domain-containing protein n=1 Tax=Flavobacterium coralii TaxID=2838017 RepID=UPI000C6A4CD1|nr:hypothetical protein [Flavobacterium sp.]|tara:strand:- start:15932 stop:18499 length:2568 start_codon:yes stop_codon:yes gene_type:complete